KLGELEQNSQIKQHIINLEITLNDNQNHLQCRVNRQRKRMTILTNEDNEDQKMITIKGETLSLEGSDSEFNSQINLVSKTHEEAVYYVQPWHIRCTIRVQSEKICVYIESDEEKSDHFEMCIS
ncbi:hypothetical protein, partial [Bellilinea sp.]